MKQYVCNVSAIAINVSLTVLAVMSMALGTEVAETIFAFLITKDAAEVVQVNIYVYNFLF